MCATTDNRSKGETASRDDLRDAPRVLRPWIAFRRSVPRVEILPGVDAAFPAVAAAIMTALRFGIDRVLLARGWPEGSTYTTETGMNASSATNAAFLTLGVGAVLFCGAVPYVPSAKLADAPRWWRDAAEGFLCWCTGYMVYDMAFIHYAAVNSEHGWEFFELACFIHHFATTAYMVSNLWIGAGHMSALMLMFTGELTNPFMNGLFISRFAIKVFDDEWIHNLHPYVEITHAVLYSIMRTFIGPLVALHLTRDLLMTERGRQNVPRWLSLTWITLCWVVLLGSLPWTKDSIDMALDGMEVRFHKDYDYGARYAEL
uniref:TLC domain-containing protein n=1 Tax=Trieres chinensis TaxID=1514140 RepID=A0A7S1Z3C2_TRICV